MLNPSVIDSSARTVKALASRKQSSVGQIRSPHSPTTDFRLGIRGMKPVRVRISGDDTNPPALVLGGISGGRLIHRRWPDITGAGGALTADRFYRISIDWPEPARDLNGDSKIDDFADILATVLDALGVARLQALVGASFGAMVGLSFAARRLVPVSQLREVAGAIGIRARLHLIDSPFGHDAFLKSTDLLNPLLKSLLNAPDGDESNE